MRRAEPATHNVGRPAGGNLRFPPRSGANGNKAAPNPQIKRQNNMRSPNAGLSRRLIPGVRRHRRRLTPCGRRAWRGLTHCGGRRSCDCSFWFFRYRFELRKLRLNRTFVRLGALTGACAAFGVAAAVVHAVYCATVIPAVGPVPPCGRGRRGFVFALRRLGLRDPPPMGAAFRFAD